MYSCTAVLACTTLGVKCTYNYDVMNLWLNKKLPPTTSNILPPPMSVITIATTYNHHHPTESETEIP